MRIAFFTTGMTRGGAERVIATLSNHLVKSGHEASIIMLKGEVSGYPLDGRVDLRSAKLGPGVQNAFAAMRFFRHSVLDIAPDVVVAFTQRSNLMACVAKRFLGLSLPLVISERSNPFQRGRKQQLASNVLFTSADEIVCQSGVVSQYYKSHVTGVPVEVIPNPLDESCIADRPATEREAFLLSVGRLCKQKRHDLAIRALAHLNADYPSLRLKICGEGPDLEKLRQLAGALGVAENVEFCGNVPNVMRSNAGATAYLMTSDYEGFPNALIEAVSSGIPTVSTDFSPGLARELVNEGKNGFVVSVGDDEAIASAIRRLLETPLAEEELEKSAKIARDRFDLDCVTGKWLATFARVMEKKAMCG